MTAQGDAGLVYDPWAMCDAHREVRYEDCRECAGEIDQLVYDAFRGRQSLLRIRKLSHRQRVDLDTMLLLASLSRK